LHTHNYNIKRLARQVKTANLKKVVIEVSFLRSGDASRNFLRLRLGNISLCRLGLFLRQDFCVCRCNTVIGHTGRIHSLRRQRLRVNLVRGNSSSLNHLFWS